MTDTVSLWRIAADTPHYTADDLSGKGAERSGGRWNRAGTPMLYSSTSRPLACLETMVHLARTALPLNRYLVELLIPVDAWRAAVLFEPEQHVGWDAEPAGMVSIGWGTGWATGGTSLLARVPSVIVPEDVNVLINPNHPDARGLSAVKRRRWLYDPRFVAS